MTDGEILAARADIEATADLLERAMKLAPIVLSWEDGKAEPVLKKEQSKWIGRVKHGGTFV